ncbi:hypothetical protein N7510_010077 [Penicillium lagena]|uniref:uncharacterized protein n=1 Tax=Penicillium lagena TaxID=94218 RepID=UPI00253FD459|nr:uncharacterized protein N7510_010077 [Penicillium lagena]KAJ5604923.1 hypothetical protein N7510_010077 [Penicillium lagena]
MFSQELSSHNLSCHRRNLTDLSNDQLSPPAVTYPSTLMDSVSPIFQQGIPIRDSSWPVDSQVSAMHGDSEPTRALPVSLHPQISATSLSSSASLPSVLINPESSLSGVVDQPSLEGLPRATEQFRVIIPRKGFGITSYHMSVASDAYLAGLTQPNDQNYVWASLRFQPLQPLSGHLSQHFPHPQSSLSSGFSAHYNGQSNGVMYSYPPHGYQVPYLAAKQDNAFPQNQSQSPSLARPLRPDSTPGTPPLSEQPLMISSSSNQLAYNLLDAPFIPSSHLSSKSISLQSPSLVSNETVYPSPESVPTTSESEHQIRVISSRSRLQCWDHGCNGREFSTFGNLLRHQREQSGLVVKAECPTCGTTFTRTTARKIHVAQEKCKSGGWESSAE